MKRVMVVAGGQWQIPIIKKAKEMGMFVINTNLYEDSPTKEYVDVFEVSDVLDKERNLEVALKYKPDAIITDQSDIAVPTVAYLNEQLGLKGIGLEMANKFTNKYKMREICKEIGIPCPDFRLCHTVEEVKEFFKANKKIVIKPIDSQASRGVYTITSEEQIDKMFTQSISYSNSEKVVLAEQFIEGTEFTIDGIKMPEGYYSMAISEKEHYAHSPNVASALYFSHYNEKYDYDKLRMQNSKLVEKMGLPFGLTHAEYIYSDGAFYLVEIAARGGGTNISGVIVPTMTGVENNQILIKMALGQKIEESEVHIAPKYRDRCCIMQFFDFEPGQVEAIQGKEYLESQEKVLGYGFNFKEGDYIGAPTDDSKRLGYYIAYGDTKEELNHIMARIKEEVKVIYNEGN